MNLKLETWAYPGRVFSKGAFSGFSCEACSLCLFLAVVEQVRLQSSTGAVSQVNLYCSSLWIPLGNLVQCGETITILRWGLCDYRPLFALILTLPEDYALAALSSQYKNKWIAYGVFQNAAVSLCSCVCFSPKWSLTRSDGKDVLWAASILL